MDEQYFMRVKGRVLGPYAREKLQSLAKRGQLSRMHEVSTDGLSWVRASTFPEIFVSEAVNQSGGDHNAAASQSLAATSNSPLAPPAPSQMGWYYSRGTTQHGPVDVANLQLLAATGQISQQDQVWAEGMPSWIAAAQAPVLSASFPRSASGSTEHHEQSSAADLVSQNVCKAAASSRPWIVFLAVTSFIYAGLSVIGGILLLIQGADKRIAAILASGLFGLIYAAIAAVGAFLLLSYANLLNSLQHSRNPVVLEKSLDALRAFWIFLSIVLIVLLAFFVFAGVWMVAVGYTLPF